MQIGIIGAGNVGATLGRIWARQGHEVVYGTRDPEGEKMRAVLAASGPQARATSQADAASFGQVVLLALPYAALAGTLPELGDLGGKVVLDAVNHTAAAGDPPVALQIAGMLPGARVVKAFNTMGFNVMADPGFGEARADNYICGDDVDAKQTATELSRAIGLGVIDVGPLANAALVEGLAQLWIELAYRQGFGRDIAFTLLRR